MTRGIFPKICSSAFGALFAVLLLVAPAVGEDETNLQTLQMFYEDKDLVVSVTRNPKSIARTAENVTVVTAAEIEMMGAHTLPDVLNNIPGLQTDDRGSVGTSAGVSVQGAPLMHVLFLLDGVRQNFLSSGGAEVASIPIHNIERLEIVKGPASSAWGSALGGVVNIVTKSPAEDKGLGGTLSFSAGERGTRDSRGEASGTVGRLGYYLSASNLTSDGFRPHTAVDRNNATSKLRWELPNGGALLYTLSWSKNADGAGEVEAYDFRMDDRQQYLQSTLAVKTPLGSNALFDLSLFTKSTKHNSTLSLMSSSGLFTNSLREKSSGVSSILTWQGSNNYVAIGGDFEHGKAVTSFRTLQLDPGTGTYTYTSADFHQNFRTDRWGIFVNDTVTLGSLAVTPGIRYDHTPQTGSAISPSLGIAWSLGDDTIVRAYAGRGFSLPIIFPGVVQEKVITFQSGVETTRIPYLWLKTTLFKNYLRDVQDRDQDFNIILLKRLKQGIEVEVKTVPVYNMVVSASYTFIETKDRDTGERTPDEPRRIAKLGLLYNDRDGMRGALLGRYVYWNGSPASGAKDTAIIWDLNLAADVYLFHDSKLELFFSCHNIFDGAQYPVWYFDGSGRWLEGGVRLEY